MEEADVEFNPNPGLCRLEIRCRSTKKLLYSLRYLDDRDNQQELQGIINLANWPSVDLTVMCDEVGKLSEVRYGKEGG